VAQFPIPDAGLVQFLDWMLKNNSGTNEDLALRLYTNVVTPGRNSVTGDFTEATFGGYGQRLISRSVWGDAMLDTHTAKMTLSGDPFEWTPTDSGQVLIGCFIVGQATNNLYAAYRFATPRTTVAGVTLNLIPVFSLACPSVA